MSSPTGPGHGARGRPDRSARHRRRTLTAGIRRPNNHIGIGWAAPTIFLAGTPEQHERYLPKIFSGEEFWCQLFSEPDAGSDLANLATRAVRDGDEYVVNGSKIWSSGAHHSQFGILIARTDPDQPKHKGISYFICPMDLPGITMSPIVDMTTAHSFNQVFFDDVRIPASLRVGRKVTAGGSPRSRCRTSGSRCRRPVRSGASDRRRANCCR